MRIVVALGAVAVLLAGCGSSGRRGVWTLPASDLSGTRAAVGSAITARNVHRLSVRWRFALHTLRGSTPVVDATTVYVEDRRSNVFALDRETGKLEWTHRNGARNDGPNGLAVAGGRVYGATDDAVFALAQPNGRELWSRRLTGAREQMIDTAPVPWQNLLLVSTAGKPPRGQGAVYALDAATGKVRWRVGTLAKPGARYPLSVDARGRLYAGTYTDSLLVLDAATGRFLWHARGSGSTVTPVLAGDSVFDAGKGGRVVARDVTTQRRLWQRATLPSCAGGVARSMAYADGRLFVPVADACNRGQLVALAAASGRVLWRRRLAAPDLGCAAVANDVVFTSSDDGTVDGFDTRSGAQLWRARLPTRNGTCPAVAGETLFVGAGVSLVAYSLAR